MRFKYMPLQQVAKASNKASVTGFLTTTPANWAAVTLPVSTGDKVRLTYFVSVHQPSVPDQNVFMRIREYTHRPSGPSPWQVMSVGADRNIFYDSKTLSTSTLGKNAYWSGSVDVDILANTPDAVFVIDPSVDNGSCTILECQLQAEIL
jgi:hypothetical protein